MDARLGDPVGIAGQLGRGEGAPGPAQVLPVHPVGGERTTDQTDDRHAAVAQPAVHVLAGVPGGFPARLLPVSSGATGSVSAIAGRLPGEPEDAARWPDRSPGTLVLYSEPALCGPPELEGDAHDHRSDRRCRAHRRREAQREAARLARRRPGLRVAQGAGGAQQARSRPRGRRDHGLRHAGLRAVAQHRAQRRAGRGMARVRAGDDDRPPVRVVTAGPAFRRPGRDGRRLRHRRGGGRREHDAHPDGLLGRQGLRLPVRPAHDGPLPRRGGPQSPAGPGHRGRDDRRPVGHPARRARRLLGAEPPAGGPGHGRGPLRERDRPGADQGRGGQRHRRAPARPTRASVPTRAWRRWPT